MTVKSYISEMSICTLGRLLSVRFWENPRKPPVRFCLPPSSSTGPKSKIKRITLNLESDLYLGGGNVSVFKKSFVAKNSFSGRGIDEPNLGQGLVKFIN